MNHVSTMSCSACLTFKSYTEFYPRKEGGYRKVCKACQAVKREERYNSDASVKENAQAATKLKRKRRVRHLERYKLMVGCAHCGYREDAFCLDFHHTDPSKKEKMVSALVTANRSRIFKEIRKCIVLCAICHRLEHKRLKSEYK